MAGDPVPVAALIVDAFERLDIPYLIGGSLASSLHGIPRLTNDVDIVADMRPAHVAPLLEALGDTFMIDEATVRDAISRRSSFNVIHFELVEKVDVFVLPDDAWSHERIKRRHLGPIEGTEGGRSAYYSSPEDTVLAKLRWYQLGRGMADRQWTDVIVVLRVQGARIDQAYLDRWAEHLGVADLLARARRDARAID